MSIKTSCVDVCAEVLKRVFHRDFRDIANTVYWWDGILPNYLGNLRAAQCIPLSKLFEEITALINTARSIFLCPSETISLVISSATTSILNNHGRLATLPPLSSTRVYLTPFDNIATIENSFQESWVCVDIDRRLQALVGKVPASGSNPEVGVSNYDKFKVYLEGLVEEIAEPYTMKIDGRNIINDAYLVFLNTGGATSVTLGAQFTLALLTKLRSILEGNRVKHISITQLPVDVMKSEGVNSVNVRKRLRYIVDYIRCAGLGAVILVEPSIGVRATGEDVEDFILINDLLRFYEVTASYRGEVGRGMQFSDFIQRSSNAIANDEVLLVSRVMTVNELNRKIQNKEPISRNLLIGRYIRRAITKLSGSEIDELRPKEAYLVLYGPSGAISGIDMEEMMEWVGCDVNIVPVEVRGTAMQYLTLLLRYDVPLLKALEKPSEFFS